MTRPNKPLDRRAASQLFSKPVQNYPEMSGLKSGNPVSSDFMWMTHFCPRRLALAVLLLALLSASACSKLRYGAHNILKPPVTWTAAYRQGRTEARTDLAAGRLRYRTHGMATVWDGPDLYAQHLRNDYNIELVTVAGCVVTPELINRTRGYNEAALPVIEARYGKGILERVRGQAVEEWRRTHPSR